jgi:hypothetical protein
MGRAGTEQGVGPLPQQTLAVGEGAGLAGALCAACFASAQKAQDPQDRVDVAQHVRLRSPQGGQAERGQPLLQAADVVPAQG